VIPVVNEHDSISTEEIRYGDNDRLAARVAAMAGADLLVLLSDIDGLYTADPKANPAAQHIPRIDVLDDTIYNMAGETRDHRSSGGMKTKLQAAEIATSAGCQMLIALGMMSHPIRHIMQGGRFSWFTSHETPLSARKHWIANPATIRGKLTVDAGAVTALMAGRSLLPSGIRAIEGDFDRGDTVSVMTPEGEELARGLTGYPATDVKRIAGRHSDDGQQILGYIGPKEVIHRDDMVLLS
jgi:glutamate 5-kinase